jgi:hypothetical protein
MHREPVILKLSNDADRVFAMEMSNLHMTMTNIVSGMTARAAPVAGQATKYMDCTMMGLQMLRDTYGADSEEFQAAYESVVALTNNVMEDLCRCHGDRVLGQVRLTPTPAPPDSLNVKQPLDHRNSAFFYLRLFYTHVIFTFMNCELRVYFSSMMSMLQV